MAFSVKCYILVVIAQKLSSRKCQLCVYCLYIFICNESINTCCNTINITTIRHTMASKAFTRNVKHFSSIPTWASFDPLAVGTTSSSHVHAVTNIVDGKQTTTRSIMEIVNPMNKDVSPIFTIPDTQLDEIEPFIKSLRKCPKSGMHNPLKNPERYLEFGEISRKVRKTRTKNEMICTKKHLCTRI